MNIVLFSADDFLNGDCVQSYCVNSDLSDLIGKRFLQNAEDGCCVFYKNDERYQHIKKVLHLKEGDAFKAGLINGNIGEALISHLSEEKIVFSFSPNRADKIEDRTDADRIERKPLPLPPIKIILGFPRPIQLRRILRDAASLGFAEIILCGTELGERSYLRSNLSSPEEIKKYIIDGISQAGQTLMPEFSFCNSVKEALKDLSDTSFSGSKVLLDIGDFPSLSTFKMQEGEDLTIAIGSERGWTQNERETFLAEGFVSYSMGKRILRTETAITSALAVLLANNGFWG
ncbi:MULTISPECIES: 16S rRNA (uracil(1498)-N(3))-methyltransferase [unclassified Treponema]|uniref:16S rRNA (uracil(1498)-N(3))-methyltransferase n=1 Tax=unclassified Treponema TaxID=2638727 RepID=UPI0020A32823|nr:MULTISPECIES: 16S rRNA (uracil(1498)-N(3))-methyltransferase [unclassified Treponema]UTC66438.1 16S rRNA (uracil(1498)-N(3))-methyltransferase [Treponema sp. OMZ 789]UTC69169.1 16S rRNA (uracil(1498)-N(3))-methyltransferase [Treponema sp. OMZ 790]UTC71882.1 16S rRNA (uracil(1498)-N(3))-methyltransferase [Treponema sp. OMZ 791]